ncbi:MAG: hypothetical protein PHU61_02095 [Candidatus Absconditabacteria bacterium]|nr:hypothetical protein [Candidatus Absconditabacteria bacterium]MDD3868772.1 hypothetical protein [Candidatus Absconditabacteria bacterium]MDD4713925.1 hypothetical protein [Candidatus Absconditabacteria bacterium]
MVTTLKPDYCPNGDFSLSYYDKTCSQPSEENTDTFTRVGIAKVISIYVTKYLDKVPDTSGIAYSDFGDLHQVNKELQGYVVQSCQLGLMGSWANGVDYKSDFSPNDRITRVEVGTLLSRFLGGNRYAGTEEQWYLSHMVGLRNAKIITREQFFFPFIDEIRGEFYMMLLRTQR